MLFNSLIFLIFLPVAFILYWFVFNTKLKVQNALILGLSYFFYGWWDWRFLFLILASTLLDFWLGLLISKTVSQRKKKQLLFYSLLFNLGVLGVFKYFNFFKDNFETLLNSFGFNSDFVTLDILLPVGISFYTFQTLSYTIDVYRGKLKATDNFLAFASFVSFFPQLVAGPIERASNLLPQFYKKRHFKTNLALDGVKQIVWGFFMKVVIADNCATYSNLIFEDYSSFNAGSLFLGGVMFAFQIYGDFAGYSNIAIGVARLFGFSLMQNFAFPYFSRDIAEFWRRWHISLSTWFRDYLYIPLGGSRGNLSKKIRNIFIIFVVSGFWHGANWTFIAWGFLNALYFLPLMLLKKNRRNIGIIGEKGSPRVSEFFSLIITFFFTVIAWIFFRAENINIAVDYVTNIFVFKSGRPAEISGLFTFILICFLIIEWFGRKNRFALQNTFKTNPVIERLFIYIVIISIFLFGEFFSDFEFIYFQF